jgi:hypothetical protein
MIDLTGMANWEWACIALSLGIAAFFGVHWALDRLAKRVRVKRDDEDYSRWIA